MRLLGILLSAIVLVAGCGDGHEVDEQAWKADLEAQGRTVEHWAKFRELWVNDLCKKSNEELTSFVAVSLDHGDSPELLRTNVRYACPDRTENLRAAFSDLQDAHTDVKQACSLPESARTEKQSQIAEAMGCS